MADSPTTVDTVSADATAVGPQHAHLPLVVMLVLSQWSVGVLLASLVLGIRSGTHATLGLGFATGLAAAAAGASFFHLGQPLKAWRVVLGWSHSWLSREALALGAFVTLAATATALALAPTLNPSSTPTVAEGERSGWSTVVLLTALAAAVVGLVTVFCSARIYTVTGRHGWRAAETFPRFAATVVTAALSWWLAATVGGEISGADAEPWWTTVPAAGALAVVAVLRSGRGRAAFADPHPDARRTERLLRGPLRPTVQVREWLLAAGTGAIVLGTIVATGAGPGAIAPIVLVGLGAGVLVAADLADRRLFFQACAPATMPGGHR
jgi:DMSO reductase anchor subunit